MPGAWPARPDAGTASDQSGAPPSRRDPFVSAEAVAIVGAAVGLLGVLVPLLLALSRRVDPLAAALAATRTELRADVAEVRRDLHAEATAIRADLRALAECVARVEGTLSGLLAPARERHPGFGSRSAPGDDGMIAGPTGHRPGWLRSVRTGRKQ